MAKTLRELAMTPVVYRVAGMDAIAPRASNLQYRSDHPLLLMDVYAPSLEQAERAPLVLLVHGSAPVDTKPKDWGIFQSWGRLLAASGLAAATFNHRMIKSDVSAALAFVHANAESWNADPERIGMMVWSGGGPLLGIEKPAFVRCAAAFYAILDCSVPEIPIFVGRAGRDAIPGVNEAIDRFVSEALEANASLTLMNHASGEHGFDNQNDDDRSREIIRSAIAFLRVHLQADILS